MSELSDYISDLTEGEQAILTEAGVPKVCWNCWGVRYRLAEVLDALAADAVRNAIIHEPTVFQDDEDEVIEEVSPLERDEAMQALTEYSLVCPGSIKVHSIEYPSIVQIICGRNNPGV